MANIKSAKKRHRQSLLRRNRNRALRTRLRAAVKNCLLAAEKNEGSGEALKQAQATLNKAVTKGIIHRNTASRRAGRLARRVHKAAASN
ncbi:MAG: 30S ribosomal protein S20 [bacterium]|nr:30S ribosomal protein S20 [bacterium]